jgi:acetyltransferase-like isoleucine patch superfamily enzyme
MHYTAIGECEIQPGAIVGLMYRTGCDPTILGNGACIRAGSIIYCDVVVGENFQVGHNALVRERTRIGRHVVVGTNTVIDGNVDIGDFVKIESSCYIPTHTRIGSRVFFGPNVVLTNDRYPLKMRDTYRPEGPTVQDGVTLGAGVVVCPGVTIGEGSFIAAGAVVTKHVPARSFVTGVPGRLRPLPDHLRELNTALSWRKHFTNNG